MKPNRKKKARTPQKPRASSSKAEDTRETETAPERGELILSHEAEPDAEYAALVERGRAAVRDMARSLWELGDAACEVETKYDENRLQRFAADVGTKFKTVQSARTTVKKWPEKSRRLDFSTCQALNAQIDRHNIARRRPDITMAQARDLVKRRKKKRDEPSEVERLVGQLNRGLLNILKPLIEVNKRELAEVDSETRRELWDRLDTVREQMEMLFNKLENVAPDEATATATMH